MSRTCLTPALLAAAAIALAGCATTSQTPEQAVQQRANARWQALIKGDFDKAWTYTTPKFRSEVKQADYKERFSATNPWISAHTRAVECQPALCLAKMQLTLRNVVPGFAKSMPEITTYFDEAWVREEGQWWYNGQQLLHPSLTQEPTEEKAEEKANEKAVEKTEKPAEKPADKPAAHAH